MSLVAEQFDEFKAALMDALHYCAVSGEFRWIKPVSNRVRSGDVAGHLDRLGYITISFQGRLYLGHRMAWLFEYGEWPSFQIDHANGIRNDNRICNLREATPAQNKYNARRYKSNRSGFKGVHWSKSRNAWRAQVSVGGKQKHLGMFSTREAAHAAYCAAASTFHGEFANFGESPQ